MALTLSSSDKIAVLIFIGSALPAWYAWRSTSMLGNKMPTWRRLSQRIAFVLLVFLGFFGTVVYAAWKLRAIVGMPPDLYWLPPAMLAWSAISYLTLKMNTHKEVRHETPS